MAGRSKLQFGDMKNRGNLFNFMDAYGKLTPGEQNSSLRIANSLPFVFFLIYCFLLMHTCGKMLFANNIPEIFLTYPWEGKSHI